MEDSPYDFYARSLQFARRVRCFLKKLPRNSWNMEYTKQVARSSSSIGANYIEARESMSRKDGLKSLRISRKEAAETPHWLHLFDLDDKEDLEKEMDILVKEVGELKLILTSMIKKVE